MLGRDLVRSYVERNLSTAPDALRGYTLGPQNERLLHRWAYYRLRKVLDEFISGRTEDRWIILSGLRGTGKTTLLAQLYFDLLDRRMPQKDLLYVSLDEATRLLGSDLREVVASYEAALQTPIERLTRNVFLFVDEAHYDRNWSIAQKSIFDRSRRVFMITTGSSALSLQSGSDTARRARYEKLMPLNFPEYFMLKSRTAPIPNLKSNIEDALFMSGDAREAYARLAKLAPEVDSYWLTIRPFEVERFLTSGTLPFTIGITDEDEKNRRVASILSKVIEEDIPAFRPFDRDTLAKIWALLMLLSVSERTSYESLCSELRIARATLADVLDVLVKSDVIYPIRAYGSVSRGVRKTPNYKFVAPVLKATLLWKAGKLTRDPITYGRLLEDAVASTLNRIRQTEGRLQFYHDPQKGGADFVVEMADRSKVVVEVGYGDKGIGQIARTSKKVDSKYGVLISEGDLELDKDESIVRVPKRMFLSI